MFSKSLPSTRAKNIYIFSGECKDIHGDSFAAHQKKIGKIKTAWNKARERAGLGEWVGEGDARKFEPNFRWHDFRHTFASWHAMSGTPLEVLQKLGGWSDMRMVMKYAHLSPSYIAQFTNNAKPFKTAESAMA